MFFHRIPSLIPKFSSHYCEEGPGLWNTSSVQLVCIVRRDRGYGIPPSLYCEESLGPGLWNTSSVQLVSVPDTQHGDGTTVQHTASNTK